MIYLDNAATSFHKPDCVPRAVVEAMQHAGNSGRGSSGEAMAASRLIFNTRCQIAEMFDVWGPECVAFTSNDTEALNIALQGTLHPEEGTIHAICTEMDHNSVLRPLYRLEKKGMKLTDIKGMIYSLEYRNGAVYCELAAGNSVNLRPDTLMEYFRDQLDCFPAYRIYRTGMMLEHGGLFDAAMAGEEQA